MNFGFSYVGLIFLIMLFVPNIIWTKYKPTDYDKYVLKENKVLTVFEKVGQVSVTSLCLIFSDFNVNALSWRLSFLCVAFLLMILYEIYWIRYFKSERRMADMYSSLLRIPVAGATLPVLAFAFLAIYGMNVFLAVAVVILGVGHIGIHVQHSREIRKKA